MTRAWLSPRQRAGRMRRSSWAALLATASLVAGCSGEVTGPLSPFAAGSSDGPGGTGARGTVGTGPGAKGVGSSSIVGVTGQPLDCKAVNVGATPLQRLSRAQYTNSIRDLLGTTVDSNALPEDEKVGVFDGNLVTPVSDLVVESYMSVAEQTAKAVLPNIEKVVPCDRTKLGDPACATQFIATFGQRVYRRPLQDVETASYQTLYTTYKAGGYPSALRVIVQTMLQSPNFLYRVELVPLQAGAPITSLDAYELASRLSFFLISTTPDDALLAAASSGALLTDDGLKAQVERLLKDPRFSDTVDSFHLQWLDLEGLENASKDATMFPAYNAALGAAMQTETSRFVNYVLTKDDAKLSTLLTAPYSFPEGPLLGLYGLKAGATPAGSPVQLDPKQRAGLLTQPSFLTVHSHYNQSGPVQRGKVVIRNVLCQVLPDPPPNVDTTPPDPSPTATTREQLVQHTADPTCAGCHTRIDNIGFGFEEFDAIGAFRATQSGKSVDATGSIIGTSASDGSFDGVPELARKLADSAEVQQCVATQWLRFALGRLEADADACTLDGLFKDFESTGFDIRVLLQSIALSDAFRSKRVLSESSP
ncbi:MAG: hypothetical protein JWN04_3787 [Myxococcaceae bacterium]|nr:hypothetical protein [Myxococcaceae bacterium]